MKLRNAHDYTGEPLEFTRLRLRDQADAIHEADSRDLPTDDADMYAPAPRDASLHAPAPSSLGRVPDNPRPCPGSSAPGRAHPERMPRPGTNLPEAAA